MRNSMEVATDMTRELTEAVLEAEPEDAMEVASEVNRRLWKQLRCLQEVYAKTVGHGVAMRLGYIRLKTKCGNLERELVNLRGLVDARQ